VSAWPPAAPVRKLRARVDGGQCDGRCSRCRLGHRHDFLAVIISSDAALTVFWHHGTPNTGATPEPLSEAAADRGIRWVSHDAVVSGAGTAPFAAEGLDWFAGMAPSAEAEMRAAAAGRAACEKYLASAEFDMDLFTPADQAALAGEWSWLAHIAGQAIAGGPDGMIDDELAYVTPWGFAPEQVAAPALFLCGGQDRMVPSTHSTWLARHCPAAELWLRPDDGHVSVLGSSAVAALDWLTEHR